MNDYQPPSGPPNPQANQTNGNTVAALVLGILGIVIPYIGVIIGIIAIVIGKKAMNLVKQTGEGGYGMALAGFICGIVGVCLWGLIDIIVIFFIGIVAASAPYL
ncbi:DUF4190 domain-containing protein [Camelliibacillus cellulosilyticus]|uniref:DUF4190 domain-containing protein n=1 Tax=Camelliibacillus cellulosilyticus TaxID=2174486 RepID=A0ABV9GTM3_9BACL